MPFPPHRPARIAAVILALCTAFAPSVTPAQEQDPLRHLDPTEERHLDAGGFAADLNTETTFPGTPGESESLSQQKGRRAAAEGMLLMRRGQVTTAFEKLSEAVRLMPENSTVTLAAIDAAIQLSNLVYAEAEAKRLLELNPQNAEAMVRLAQCEVYRNRIAEAEAWLKKTIEAHPTHEFALRLLAQIAYEVHRDMAMVKDYTDRILAVSRLNLQALVWNAEAAAMLGDVDTAVLHYNRILANAPNQIRRLEDLASRLERNFRVDDALKLYEVGMARLPDVSSLRLRWEAVHHRRGGPEEVLSSYETLVGEHPFDLRLRELFAEYLSRTGNFPRLETLRRAMLDISPDHIPSIIDLGRIHLARGENDQADAYFDAALDLNANDGEILRRIGRQYLEVARMDRARPFFEQALLLNEKDTGAMLGLAVVHEEEGNPAEAERLIREILKIEPANAGHLRTFAEFSYRQKRYREARELFEQAIAADPSDLETNIRLAELYFRARDGAALDRVETAMRGAGRAADVLMEEYGRIAIEWGEHERARRALERIVENNPGNYVARAALALSYEFLRRPELADRAIREGIAFAERSNTIYNLRMSLLDFYAEVPRQEEEIENLQRLLAMTPTHLELRRSLMLALAGAGNKPAAEEQFNLLRAALSAPDAERGLRFTQAGYLGAIGDKAGAYKLLKQLHEEDPADELVRFRLAYAASDMGAYDEMEVHYRKMMEGFNRRNPDATPLAVTAANNLAYSYAKRGVNLEEGRKLAAFALDQQPRAGYILDTAGLIEFRLGNLERARELLEDAASISLRDAEVFENLGDVYTALGKLDAAKEAYQRAMAVDPTLEHLKAKVTALAGK